MAEKKKQIQLPKDALSRVSLGHSFAEYDLIRSKPEITVRTPALLAAEDRERSKCFFVGRRGTGKTAITYRLASQRNSAQILPQVIVPAGLAVGTEDLKDTRQRPFRSLLAAFKRNILEEVLAEWNKKNYLKLADLPCELTRERNLIEDFDFDLRLVKLMEEIVADLAPPREKGWLRQIGRPKDMGKIMDDLSDGKGWEYTLLIDRVDEAWDGSDRAVIFLMALMHACVELTGSVRCVRPLLFLRENIFERVRQIDNEFSRLETFVVSLDWSQSQLVEFVERRLNLPFNSKLPLGGETWNYFFEGAAESRKNVFEYCQERPRDVLTYCSFAVEAAQSNRHQQVMIEDMQAARLSFSKSRLKDLGDEYAENYSQLQLVLSRFHGLGREFTVPGITDFIKKLLVDEEVKAHCSNWIFRHTTPEGFIELLYNIGFVGIGDGAGNFQYRSLGARSSTGPAISASTHVIVHPSYAEALGLQNVVVESLSAAINLQSGGMLIDLPEAISLDEYTDRLGRVEDNLKTLPCGQETAGDFEDLVGDVLKLCFFRSLTNVAPKVRNVSGLVIRDWIGANVAHSGFWEIVRQRYQATQVVWECKNYSELSADDFHQASYYMTREIGRFVVIAFRGEVKKHYYEHIQRIASEKEGGVVLPIQESDLKVFVRQARNGKVKESHIQEIYDRTVRAIS
jgi:hypothetical protein